MAFLIRCLKPLTIHIMCNELVAKVVECHGEVQSSIFFMNTSTSHHVSGKGLLVRWMSLWNVCDSSFFGISLSKNSQVTYSHHPYKISHLHNFPCLNEYSHYQSRGMCKIPTLSTFPSKPCEPRDMKGNFGKFSHWDTSESSKYLCLVTTDCNSCFVLTVFTTCLC
jgi:hypothetical protein